MSTRSDNISVPEIEAARARVTPAARPRTGSTTIATSTALGNLLEGAAGQAIGDRNAMLGLERMTGLTHVTRHA